MDRQLAGSGWGRHWGAAVVLFVASACTSPTSPDAEAVTGDDANWDAESVREEGASTHLWIVDRALDILGKHTDDPNAKKALALLTRDACRAQWQQGLFDADFLHEYNGARYDLHAGVSDVQIGLSGATWQGHFFDPDTGLNYKGERAPTASSQALFYLQSARQKLARDMPGACYAFGLSLHFFTDLTQPMHAANFTSLSRPRRLHSNVETWSMQIQSEFARSDWSGAATVPLEAFVVQVARASKASWGTMFNVIADAYDAHWNGVVCGNLRASVWNVVLAQQIDHPMCWNTNAAVKAQVGQSLRQAQDVTAQYLAMVGGLD